MYQASPIFDSLRPPWSWLLYVAVIRRQKEITRSCQGIFDRIIIELLVADTTFSLYLDVIFLWGKWHRLVTMTMLVYSLVSFPQDPMLDGGNPSFAECVMVYPHESFSHDDWRHGLVNSLMNKELIRTNLVWQGQPRFDHSMTRYAYLPTTVGFCMSIWFFLFPNDDWIEGNKGVLDMKSLPIGWQNARCAIPMPYKASQ